MTPPHGPHDTDRDDADRDDAAPGRPTPASPDVSALVSRLDGVERHPLATQVEVLDAVRRGLDEALTRPALDGTAGSPATAAAETSSPGRSV